MSEDVESTVEVLQSDAFDALRRLEGASSHAAVVDYPWEFKSHGNRPGASAYQNDEDWEFADKERIGEAIGLTVDALVDGAWLFVFADDDVLPQFRKAVETHATYRKTLVWDTKRLGLGHYFRSRHGYIIAATVGDTDRYVRGVPTVLEAAAPQRQPGRSDTYPTAKPASLVEEFLAPVTNRGERVIEPFCGSAPSLEAANSLGLRYWGADISEDALRRARRRAGQTTLGGVQG